MSKLTITRGEWKPDSLKAFVLADQGSAYDAIICDMNRPIHDSEHLTKKESEDAAILIADAGNTFQSCGLLPSELLKQRDELLAALKDAYGIMEDVEVINMNASAVKAIKSVINNAEK